MQKIALVSYHFFRNYGTCLQAFALQYIIRSHFNIDCEYLDFGQSEYPGMFPKRTLWSEIKAFRRKLLVLKYAFADEKSTSKFRGFKKHLQISRRYRLDELHNTEFFYSKFIVGSDQTWSPTACSKKYYPPMLLAFVKESQKKYSYAPSLGNIEKAKTVEPLFKKCLCNFNMISTRERVSQEYLSELLGREVSYVLDPTLLLSSVEWIKIASKCRTPYTNYVFCYLLGTRDAAFNYARDIANRYNKRLIVLSVSTKFKKLADIYPSGIGPFEFVNLIANADYVVTDSFHGTAFCLNFNKQFYSFYKHEGGRNMADNRRIFDLLDAFEQTQNIIDEEKLICEPISFVLTNKILESERKHSLQYLQTILNK